MFILANSADPDETPHFAASHWVYTVCICICSFFACIQPVHLGLHCLYMYMFLFRMHSACSFGSTLFVYACVPFSHAFSLFIWVYTVCICICSFFACIQPVHLGLHCLYMYMFLFRMHSACSFGSTLFEYVCVPFSHALPYTLFCKIFLDGSGQTGLSCRFYLCKYIFYVSLALEIGNPMLGSLVGLPGGWEARRKNLQLN